MTGSDDSSRPPDRRSNPAPFYDDVLSVSAKTTFEAVTHALHAHRLDRHRRGEPRRRAGTRRTGRVRQRRGHRRARRPPVPDVCAPDGGRPRDARRGRSSSNAAPTTRCITRAIRRIIASRAASRPSRSRSRRTAVAPTSTSTIAPRAFRRRCSTAISRRPTRMCAPETITTATSTGGPASRNGGAASSGSVRRRTEAIDASSRPVRHSDDASPRQEEHRRDGRRLPEGVAGRRRHRRGDGLRLRALVRVPGPRQRQSRGLRPRSGARFS